MNLIISGERTRLLINRVSNLMLIKLHGPPRRKWKSEEYVESCFRRHRSATDKRTRNAKFNNPTAEDPVWKYLLA